ncbi:MAG TPA: glycosyl hydrolase family 65 protein [Solirubrobacter sp.]|nr:glycosyl hydrolase family 65 protein [Solirubrobacter sp.]
MPPHSLDIHDWRIAERAPGPPAHASIFAVGNGYLGVRDDGVILNGFHETWPILYPEDAYGMARTGQSAVNAPDGAAIRLFVDGEALAPGARTLDMRDAVVTSELRDPRVWVRSRRLASLTDRHLVALRYEIVALQPIVLTIASELVMHAPSNQSDDPRRGREFGLVQLGPRTFRTRDSGLQLDVGVRHEIETDAAVHASGDVVFSVGLDAGQSLTLTKFVAYHRDGGCVERTLDRATDAGFAVIERDQREAAADFWRDADIEVDAPGDVQGIVRFNLFQLLQATARVGGHGIAAKGVTGHGYEGHYFWDTEVYVAPFLTHVRPRHARDVLAFRVGMLDAARRRARELNHRGALFPWRTITGEEASARYVAGTAQYHINADIAHALRKYRALTGDDTLMLEGGADVLVETARFWLGLGFFSERKDGQFVINAVTGPDEYTTVVDNNAYTNLMARENLEAAADTVEWLAEEHPLEYTKLVDRTGLVGLEPAAWRRAAARMYIPRQDGLILQDDAFMDRRPWDFASTPPERYPLLLHYHPLEIFRHQVIKQADVVLATYLAGHHFTAAEIRRTFDYYDPLTTGDSTLSAAIQSVVASAAERPQAALDYFHDAATVDLHDTHGNAADGIHVASCGGTWLALVAGFGGLRDYDGEARFAPRLPDGWSRLRFRLQLQGQRLEVDMTPGGTTYTLLEGDGLTIRHFGQPVRVSPDNFEEDLAA